MATPSISVGAADRLSFTLFVALAFHAVIIFGLSFNSRPSESTSPTLDVTLSQYESEDEVTDDEADFLAQNSQQGSGTLEEKAKLQTTEEADIDDNQIFHTTPTIQHLTFSELSLNNDRIIATTANSDHTATAEYTDDGTMKQSAAAEQLVEINTITDVSTLKALLEESRQSYAKRPRVRTLTAVSTKRAVDAEYIFDWLKKVERIGNQNYPDAAKNQRLSGSVRLAVSINSDGSLRNVVVTGSSGHSLLDQAAKQIVYLSAPYSAFKPDMLEQYDVLEIIRTWQFRVDSSFGVSNDG